jgi:vacuolar protein sorting-associated protein VTA1
MSVALAQNCPSKAAKIFLARALEFDGKDPATQVVGYWLRMHALNVLMSEPRNPQGRTFLFGLVDFVEAEKKRLAPQIEAEDGRLVLTRTGLMLFALADDMERASAAASEKALKLFYTASILFEATAQFNNGTMDPILAEKHKYARYVANLMKKTLEHGAPYVSPSGGVESAALENLPMPPSLPPPPTAAAQGYPQQPQGGNQGHQHSQPPQSAPPAPAYNPPPAAHHQQPATPQPHPQSASLAAPSPAFQPAASAPMPRATSTTPAMSVKEGRVKADRVLAAEKHAKQAIAALQFFDEATARTQLQHALAALDQ